VNLYRKMHNRFFLECARHRMQHFIMVLSEKDIISGKYATEDEIADFTLAYMQGGEL
jgi:hypothetical protein